MARPKIKEPKNKQIVIRLTTKEHNKLKGLARLYTKEGISDFVRMVVFSYEKLGSRGC